PLVPVPVSEARAQVFRSAENHAAGAGLPPARVLPVTTYPAGPAAAAVRPVPGAVSGPLPRPGAHDPPPAHVQITRRDPSPAPRRTPTRAPRRAAGAGGGGWGAPRGPRGEPGRGGGPPRAAPGAPGVRRGGAGALTVMPGGAAGAGTDCPPGRRPPPPVTSRY